MPPTTATSHVKRLTLRKIAGYASVVWDGIQPDLNFLLGRNGAGKSSVLEALAVGLNFMGGRRTEGVLTTTYPDGEIEILLAGAAEPWLWSFGAIHRHQGPRPPAYPFTVLYWVENRQPKTRMGEMRSALVQHPLNRYPNSLSELKTLLRSRGEDGALGREVLDLCRRLTAAGTPDDWRWIEAAVLERGPKHARPASCGQFDIIALILDLVRLRNSLPPEARSPFIVLDNPETFLHPACQEPLLALARELIPDAQIFISSHSLKLLCHREPKAVFWLSRDRQDASGAVQIQSVRELESGSKSLFYELYGEDVSSAILALLHAFQSPEYYRFLCECTLAAETVVRADPSRDRQFRTLREYVVAGGGRWKILDYGAGGGDLLAALTSFGDLSENVTYIACDVVKTKQLENRVKEAQERAKIAADSRVINDLNDAPADCDVIVLCNVCHEILLPELPRFLARLLTKHVAADRPSRIIIHEVEQLTVGEAQFVMWTPDDYLWIFDGIPGLNLAGDRRAFHGSVPLDTTVISRDQNHALDETLGDLLVRRFWQRIDHKKTGYLDDVESLTSVRAHTSGLQEALRQRRLASSIAQIATMSLLERRRPAV